MQVYYSPQLGSGTKNSSSFRNSGAYTSPGTPDYERFHKGWCSERVPLSNSSRRNISSASAALLPFNSGRTLPSKWDDAERWITSPVSKAKSGPLGGNGNGMPVVEGGRNIGFLSGSPLMTGVIVPDGLALRYAGTSAGAVNGDRNKYWMNESGNVGGWSEFLIESSYPDSQDENNNENGVSRVASRRDMATQMSSPETSPTNTAPSMEVEVEQNSHHSARLEVRDVQVDKGATITKQSKRHRMKTKNTPSPEATDLALTWNTTQGAMKLSKLEKEEARIAAWENLQNAKAEASIRKLEMKLEKKKAASLDKIIKKHRAAQMKAEEMRRNMAEEVSPRSSHKFRSLQRFATNTFKGCFLHRDSW